MSINWYYARNRQRYGPVTYDQIQYMALNGHLAPQEMVLNEGARVWVSARDVPGLAFAKAAGSFPAECRSDAEPRMVAWQKLQAIAQWQRWLNLVALVWVLGEIVAEVIGSGTVYIAWRLVLLLTSPVWLWLMLRVAHAVDLMVWVCWLVVLLPLVTLGLLLAFPELSEEVFFRGFLRLPLLGVLLALSWRANEALRRAGFRVGFLGTVLPDQPPISFSSIKKR